MTGLVICRQFGTNPAGNPPCFADLAKRCRECLDNARSAGLPVIHVYSHWPEHAALLNGCSAIASEPVFTDMHAPMFRSRKVVDAVRQASGTGRVFLAGVSDAYALSEAIGSARCAGLNAQIIPSAMLVLEGLSLARHQWNFA